MGFLKKYYKGIERGESSTEWRAIELADKEIEELKERIEKLEERIERLEQIQEGEVIYNGEEEDI